MSKALEEFDANVIGMAKTVIYNLLYHCTQEQREMFDRAYPHVSGLPMKKLREAIMLCERTVLKNRREDSVQEAD